jgi:hypothetical protein
LDLVNAHIDDITGNITSFERSKFDDYVVQTTPLQHHELSTVTRTKIMNWLGKNFNIGVNYNFVEGGSADPDNYQVRILHGIPITVQPKNINVNGRQVTYNFAAWEDGNTDNPRTFYTSHDVSHTATMKAHLVSFSNAALGNNSQRKLVRTNDNKFYMAYQSGNGSFWTSSTDNGATWTPEQTIGGVPNDVTIYRNPTLILSNNGLNVNKIVEEVHVSSHSVWTDKIVHHYECVNGWPKITVIKKISTFDAPLDFEAQPCAIMMKAQGDIPETFAAIWRENFEGIIRLHFAVGTEPLTIGACYGAVTTYFSGYLDELIPGSTQNPIHPTVAVRVIGGQFKTLSIPNYWFYIVWEEPGVDGGIKFAYGTHYQPPLSMAGITWNNPLTIAANNSTITNSNPSIAVDGSGNVMIAWEYYRTLGQQGKIKVQKRLYYDYSTASESHEFSNNFGNTLYNPHAPFLTDYRYTTSEANNFTLVWYTQAVGSVGAQYASNTWSSPYILNNQTMYPSVEESYDPLNTNRSMVSLNCSSSPYTVQYQTIQAPQPPNTPTLSYPNNGDRDVDLSGWFSWSQVFAASSYRLVVSANPDLSNPVLDISNLIQPGYGLASLTSQQLYYWRVNATNSNGTSSWSATWSFTAGTASGGGGCPFVYTWNGNRFVEDNNILPQSEYNITSMRDVTDYYKLQKPLVLQGDDYVLQVKENESERSRFDQFRLFVIDHPVGTRIAVDDIGEITLYRTPHTLTQARLRSNDVAAKLAQFDSVMVLANAGDVLSLSFQQGLDKTGSTFSQEAGGEIGGEDPPPGQKKVSVGQIATVVTERPRGRFTFRQRPTLTYVPLGLVSSTNLTIQVDARCLLDYVNFAVHLPDTYEVQEAQLIRAVHSSSGTVTKALENEDGVYCALEPSQSVELHFAKITRVLGKQRSFIFVSKGRYEHITSKPSIISQSTPSSIALDQCYPNPFNPSTIINYQLSTPSFTNLVIYNLLGQEVERLVNAEQAAGYYTVEWKANNVSSGVYYLRMTVSDIYGKLLYQQSRKLLLVK